MCNYVITTKNGGTRKCKNKSIGNFCAVHESKRDVVAKIFNIESLAMKNTKKGPVIIATDMPGKGGRLQVAVTSLKSGEDIPYEIHQRVTQFVRVEDGEGVLFVNDVPARIGKGDSFTIPSGVNHRILCTGKSLKLYSIYAKDSKDEKWIH